MALAGYTGKKSSVGRYELIEQLGEGGMGIVWRALDSKTGGEVAIKIMKDISDDASMELFTKEWRALAEMSHPNIVDVRDVDEFVEDRERKPFFVMPLLRGATLAELIRNSSARLTLSRVVEIIDQVCRGLQAAHQRGLVHRDLKPSNIFVMDDDTAKIIDFGVVYLAGSQSVTGQKGTFQYMSPEQVQMKDVTPASDIFSIGVILYEALTARKPFACPTAEDTMQAVLKRTPPPVSELNPAIPHAISQVVHKCLAKQPIHRFSSARELAETLKKAFRGEPIFDASKHRLRVERAKAAFKSGDEAFALELLMELESEGHIDPEISVLRTQIDMAAKQKKVRHLLESARARIDQDEIPLGLDKLRELLELDPENAEARALKTSTEKNRSEAQAGKWVDLANNHLANNDYAAARHAVQEALASRAGDPRALELQRKIDNMEFEAKRVREQKEQIYNTALRAYQNGEIDSALSRMARLFSVIRSRPEGAVPERDAVYESFYQEVRSEYDSIRSQLDEAQHQLDEEDFSQALAICTEMLARYPNNGAFQTLKIQVEDTERQKVSSYIATVSRNVDAEPDFDRRVNVLREACDRYPQEAHFAQQLKVVRERRDLINSIVAKAQQFSERGQYSDELSQWDMLRNIHPRYPGLAFELEQCRKKRDLQLRNEEKAHLVEEIVRAMEAGNFERAGEQTRLALADFPGDAELAGLETLCQESLERSREASRCFEEGQANAAAGNWSTATDLLQNTLSLDPRHAAAKDALINVLIEQARSLLDSDIDVAAHLHQEARKLDANHPAVRSVGMEIDEARQQRFVGECLTKARSLTAVGNSAAAFEHIREGRKRYPQDQRLKQFEASLLKENHELQLRQERLKRLEKIDAEEPQSSASVDRTIDVAAKSDDLSYLLRTSAGNQTFGSSIADDGKTRLYTQHSTPASNAEVPIQPPIPEAGLKKRSIMIWACVGALIVLIGVGFILHHLLAEKPHTEAKTALPRTIHMTVTPADSAIKIDGASQSGKDIAIPAGRTVVAEISQLGYQSQIIQLNSQSENPSITLVPLPVRVTVTTTEKSGDLEIDGTKAGSLVDGSIEGMDMPADGKSHTLLLTAAGRKLVNIEFQADPGKKPVITPIANTANIHDMLVISSLGTASTIYGGDRLKNTAVSGTQIKLSNAGFDVPASEQPKELTYSDGTNTATLTLTSTEQPSITIRSIEASTEYSISSNTDSATLSANGRFVRKSGHGWKINQPGTYNFVLSADKFETLTWTTVLKPRQTLNEVRNLTPRPAGPVLSALVLSGGTPGSIVELDGKTIGELDGSGAGQFPAVLSQGSHQIEFHREGFCNSASLSITANPPTESHLNAAKLDPCGSVTVPAGSQTTTVRVRHSGDANGKWIELTQGKKTPLPVGSYDVQAEAAGFNPYSSKIAIEAGHNVEFTPEFSAVQHCQLENPSSVSTSNGWLKQKSGSVVYLTPGCANVTFTFTKPKGFFKKHVEWVVDVNGGAGRVAYEVDGDKLSRKSIVQKTFDQHESNLAQVLKEKADSFRIRIHLEGSRIQVTDESGTVLDDYTAQNPTLHDLSSGRIGVKAAAEFKFSGGGL